MYNLLHKCVSELTFMDKGWWVFFTYNPDRFRQGICISKCSVFKIWIVLHKRSLSQIGYISIYFQCTILYCMSTFVSFVSTLLLPRALLLSVFTLKIEALLHVVNVLICESSNVSPQNNQPQNTNDVWHSALDILIGLWGPDAASV